VTENLTRVSVYNQTFQCSFSYITLPTVSFLRFSGSVPVNAGSSVLFTAVF